jgi:hypothetical protein
MPNLDNADNQTHIGDRIDDPIRSLADAILIIMAGKFFTAGRSRIGGKILNALDNAETVFSGLTRFFCGRRFDEKPIAATFQILRIPQR